MTKRCEYMYGENASLSNLIISDSVWSHSKKIGYGKLKGRPLLANRLSGPEQVPAVDAPGNPAKPGPRYRPRTGTQRFRPHRETEIEALRSAMASLSGRFASRGTISSVASLMLIRLERALSRRIRKQSYVASVFCAYKNTQRKAQSSVLI